LLYPHYTSYVFRIASKAVHNRSLRYLAAVLLFFIAGFLYLFRFERVDNLGAYSIPSRRPAFSFHLFSPINLNTTLSLSLSASYTVIQN
jgi:hypothetical protein